MKTLENIINRNLTEDIIMKYPLHRTSIHIGKECPRTLQRAEKATFEKEVALVLFFDMKDDIGSVNNICESLLY